MSYQVNKDSLIGEVLDYDKETAEFFFEMGMHCLGCPASRGESIEEACEVHGVDCNEMIEKINAGIEAFVNIYIRTFQNDQFIVSNLFLDNFD